MAHRRSFVGTHCSFIHSFIQLLSAVCCVYQLHVSNNKLPVSDDDDDVVASVPYFSSLDCLQDFSNTTDASLAHKELIWFEAKSITMCWLVKQFALLLKCPDFQKDSRPPSLRLTLCSGLSAPADQWHQIIYCRSFPSKPKTNFVPVSWIQSVKTFSHFCSDI